MPLEIAGWFNLFTLLSVARAEGRANGAGLSKQKQGTGKCLSNAQKKSNKKNKQAAMAKKRRK